MADADLRRLERAVAQGDMGAEVRLFTERIRVGGDAVELMQGEQRMDFLDLLFKTKVLNQEQLEQILCPSLELTAQYRSRLQNLREFGILSTNRAGIEGITAIDSKHYAPPTLEQVRARLPMEKLRLIAQIEQPTLLLVPFGMSLNVLINRVTGQPGRSGRLADQSSPYVTYIINADIDGKMVYFPDKFVENTGGVSKRDVLAGKSDKNVFPGWQVVIVDGRERIDQSNIVKGQNKAREDVCKNAHDLLEELQGSGFSGLTPEDWLSLHLIAMERGDAFDTEINCWLLASLLKLPRKEVIVCCWNARNAAVHMYGINAEGGWEYNGARLSLRV